MAILPIKTPCGIRSQPPRARCMNGMRPRGTFRSEALLSSAFEPAEYRRVYGHFANQNPLWNQISAATSQVYEWDASSRYIREPPYFDVTVEGLAAGPISCARSLALFGDSITTDHISPACSIMRPPP